MDVALWVVAAVLAVAFAGAGVLKLVKSKQELAASGLAWTDDFSQESIKAIGAIEIVGAVGLIAPAATGIAPVLVPLAATGLAITMLGAAAVHLRRKEAPLIVVNAVLLALAAFVAWGRFGPYAF